MKMLSQESRLREWLSKKRQMQSTLEVLLFNCLLDGETYEEKEVEMKTITLLTVGLLLGGLVSPAMAADRQTENIKRPRSVVRQAGTTKSAKPDLIVSRINHSPGSPLENQEITVWIFVKNDGSGPAEASGLKVAVGGESLTTVPVIPVPALPPGREWRYEKKVTFSRASKYVVKALADAGGELVESDENNNQGEKVITVKKGARPDLKVSKINLSPAKPWQNEEITFWVFVKNTGPGRAAPSTLRVQVGGESAANAPVAQVPALDPGREWRYTRKTTLGRAGKYIVTATADAKNDLVEVKENNNVKKKSFTVKKGTKPDPSTYLPDLGFMGGTRIGGKTWQNLNTAAVTLTQNDVYVMDTGKVQIQLRYEYREYNGKPINKAFKNKVFYNNQLVHEETVSSMAASEIRNKTVVWEIPNPNFNQQAQLRIVLDAEDKVTESRTNNNVNDTTITFSGI
jgi:subtilase family serine protease